MLIFAILTASRGAGSGFIMADLVDTTILKVGYGGGSAWFRLVVYTGTIMLVASLAAIGTLSVLPRSSAPSDDDRRVYASYA